MTLTTFSVGWIFETLATQEGLNVTTENLDDVCYGMVISADKSFLQVIQQHSAPYNFQIVDGDPIRLVRRAVNDSLVVDVAINEVDCIRRGDSPTIQFSRVDPSALPRQVEIQYIDPVRDYASTTQVARHTAAPRTNTQISIAIDFVISAQQARNMAFDVLYRLWSQQLGLAFEHSDLSIEPGDTISLSCTQGVFVCIVVSQTINMPQRTNSIVATILLSSKAATDETVVTAPEADSFSPTSEAILTQDSTSPVIEVLTEDGATITTEG